MATMKDDKQGKAGEEKLETKGHEAAHDEADDEAHDEAHDEAEDEDEADDEAEDVAEAETDAAKGAAEDPMWWTPHLVLAALVLLGIGAMLGLFNPLAKKYMPRVAAGGSAVHDSAVHGAAPGAPGTPALRATKPGAPAAHPAHDRGAPGKAH